MPDNTEIKIELEQVVEFQEFLMGKRLGLQLRPSGQPKLTQKNANRVIWYLQEVLRILPDNYEMCDECGELYDSDCCGYVGDDDLNYCDNCDRE